MLEADLESLVQRADLKRNHWLFRFTVPLGCLLLEALIVVLAVDCADIDIAWVYGAGIKFFNDYAFFKDPWILPGSRHGGCWYSRRRLFHVILLLVGRSAILDCIFETHFCSQFYLLVLLRRVFKSLLLWRGLVDEIHRRIVFPLGYFNHFTVSRRVHGRISARNWLRFLAEY